MSSGRVRFDHGIAEREHKKGRGYKYGKEREDEGGKRGGGGGGG